MRQILHASKEKVQAHLFHQAVEVGMKGLLVADRWNPEEIRALGHNLGNVWEKVAEYRRLEVAGIYDRELRGRPPASPAFDALVAKYSQGERGVTESLRYLGEGDGKPLADRNTHRHLWKMASALLHYNQGEIAGWATAVLGALTDFRNTIH